MPRVAPMVPAETDVLCEGCGYTLNGLPETGNCPECGKLIAESTPVNRRLPRWESSDASFWATTAQVLFRPSQFYRSLQTRHANDARARRFAIIHWSIVSFMVGIAANLHICYLSGRHLIGIGEWSWVVLIITSFFALELTTGAATRLTAWEATYRGLRLPPRVIRRGLYYHAPHYLPAAGAVFVIVLVYYYVLYARLHWIPAPWQFLAYLVTLCAAIVLGAGYTFYTYWIAMRNMMYANR